MGTTVKALFCPRKKAKSLAITDTFKKMASDVQSNRQQAIVFLCIFHRRNIYCSEFVIYCIRSREIDWNYEGLERIRAG